MPPGENATITLTESQTPSFAVKTQGEETLLKTPAETVDRLTSFYAASSEGETKKTVLDLSGLSAAALQKVLIAAQNATEEDRQEITKELDKIDTRRCIYLLEQILTLDRYATDIPVDIDMGNFQRARLNIGEGNRSADNRISSISLHLFADRTNAHKTTTLILLTSDGNQRRFPVSTSREPQVAPVRLAWEEREPSLEDKVTTTEIIRILENHLAELRAAKGQAPNTATA